jgi:hypothetical protein
MRCSLEISGRTSSTGAYTDSPNGTQDRAALRVDKRPRQDVIPARPFHGGNTGSIPVGRASDFNDLSASGRGRAKNGLKRDRTGSPIPRKCSAGPFPLRCRAAHAAGLTSFPFRSYLLAMSQSRFKVSAWTPDGNHVEEELGEFANLVVATESWHVFVGYYAKRRMTLRQGARVIREHIPAIGVAPTPP